MRWIGVAVLGCVGSVAMAQQAAPEATGTVVGHVYLSDTGGPARLAQVALQPVAVKSDERPDAEKYKDPAIRLYRTGLDGGFRMLHVRPGSYYVVVKQPGYLSPFASFTNAQLSHPTLEDQQKIAHYLPLVTVIPNNTATMEIHLTRGASLSGTVKFDDGNPDSQTDVAVLQKNSKGTWQRLPLVSGGSTDDLGHFRITGLLEGDYLLEVQLSVDNQFVNSVLGQSTMSSSWFDYQLAYYSGDTARLRDAKPLHVDGSQEMSAADITIPLSKLHAVTGQIVEAGSGRVINSGKVTLVYADDGGEDASSATIGPDEPAFRMPFVPEGSYTLKVSDVADVNREEISNGPGVMPPFHTKETVVRRYGTAEQPLVVAGDVSGVSLAVPPVAKTP
jgi:hypothetical protein